ncbi:MAG TPA: class I SAM-dependent methyltransferase [Pyrinomonadaceae bacterium]|jgi:ubiquinone/menaquinone biosynthesis C-methylase UbiE|nr:class I SAM-dependent methyltransferase [Pyrinomonadaceae bacterium]
MSADPTKRFSSRVEDYIKYRPHYPQAVVELLRDECGLTPASVIADVGSGTGILSALFLRNGNRVVGVEPNREMREAGERLLSTYDNFVSVEGRAEATTLADASVNFVTAGQAFHWFDIEGARREFRRILRPGGWVVPLWNDRRIEGAPFLEDYERMLIEYSKDYCEVSCKHSDEEVLGQFFGAGGYHTRRFPNHQTLDFESMKGRLRSSSYTPEPGHPNFEPMMREFASIFERYQRDGRIVVEYDTKVFYGRLDAPTTS